ncbi:MAG: hypothetical protein HC909_02510 [Blastochloris sp.]|nr:hypothetical protein [Blastochloris sp.]
MVHDLLRRFTPQPPHEAYLGCPAMMGVSAEPPDLRRNRRRTGAFQPRLLADRAADRAYVDVVCPDIKCILIALAGTGLRIDGDQRVIDDLKDGGAIVAQIISLRQDPEVPKRADEARIVGLQIGGPDGADRVAVTLLQQQSDQPSGACGFHCLPASRV